MWGLIPGEGFGDLPGDPFGRRICSHVGPNQPSPCQPQDDKSIEKLEADRRNDEQIDGSDVGSVVAQKGLPARREWSATRDVYLATVDWAMSIPSFSSSP